MAVPSCTTRVCKPGSVIDSHLSKPKIALGFQPPPRNGRADLMFLHGVAPDRVYIIFRVLLEMLFPETTDLLPHIFSLEILKYTKYICNLQSLICVNISRCSKKIFSAKHSWGFIYEAPDLCLHKLGALLPHLFTLAYVFRGTYRRYISVALVLGSPPAGVTRYPCPVEPGLSSPGSRWGSGRDCPTRSRKYCTARNPTCQTSYDICLGKCKSFSEKDLTKRKQFYIISPALDD